MYPQKHWSRHWAYEDKERLLLTALLFQLFSQRKSFSDFLTLSTEGYPSHYLNLRTKVNASLSVPFLTTLLPKSVESLVPLLPTQVLV